MTAPKPTRNPAFKPVRLQHVMREVRRPVSVKAKQVYTEIGVRSHGRGVFHKDPITGDLLGNKRVFWLKPGTLVFNIVFAWERAVAVLSEAEAGLIGSHRFPTYEMLQGRAHAGFMKHYFTTGYGHYLLQLNSPGAAGRNKTLSQSALMKEEVWLPSADAQKAIAAFLDRKTAAIDALIEKKQKLLDLLAEKRAALINQAVTKGLDPNVPMKDSGIPWIGEIPAHWEVKRLKFVCTLETGHTPSRSESSYWVEEECVIPWVSLNDTKTLKTTDYLTDTVYRISELGMANSAAHLIPAGSVVFTRDATIGLTAILTTPMAVSQHIIGWVCGPDISNEFLLRVIDCMGQELDRLTFGATLKTIGMGDVKELTTPLPPFEEQEQIVSHVKGALQRVADTERRLIRQSDCLREYRQALITAAVTGQLDIGEDVA